ncbi:class I SAM-dependent methyltransferase [Flavobacterium sp. ACAM 123]|jgi:ubiquinone/menaquinone biosynthesis C-methylase UbiE|uniref:class I SAM-dependent methyltransferase n=1 Tax=Flavobacterium sp. ACAM 123 TaxID=1189620 RepID=UPI0002E95139|nr:class I SAM-dependent methyltransferase [Flavobacterium sp. ACAM 123]
MGIYAKYILPSLINIACGLSPFVEQRKKIIPLATGNVLEIGIGTGLNLPLYNHKKVIRLTAIDPSLATWKKCTVDTKKLGFNFKFIIASAEQLPFDEYSFDTVVVTYSLCTIPDAKKALVEMRRVLKPEGLLLFCEHGIAPDKRVQRVQDKINPIWREVAGGCNLNRNIPQIIEESGFKNIKLETIYIPGWKPLSYNYWGTASK